MKVHIFLYVTWLLRLHVSFLLRPIVFPSQNNGLEKFMFHNVKKVLKFQNKKNKHKTATQYNTMNTKKSYKFINKKCHDKIYSDCEWKSTQKQAWFFFGTF